MAHLFTPGGKLFTVEMTNSAWTGLGGYSVPTTTVLPDFSVSGASHPRCKRKQNVTIGFLPSFAYVVSYASTLADMQAPHLQSRPVPGKFSSLTVPPVRTAHTSNESFHAGILHGQSADHLAVHTHTHNLALRNGRAGQHRTQGRESCGCTQKGMSLFLIGA